LQIEDPDVVEQDGVDARRTQATEASSDRIQSALLALLRRLRHDEQPSTLLLEQRGQVLLCVAIVRLQVEVAHTLIEGARTTARKSSDG